MRRILTIGVAGALLVALVAIAGLLPVPYVAMSPGPTENTLGAYDGTEVVVIDGAETFPTEGRLDLTTVSVTSADSELDLLTALKVWLDPSVAVVPREQVYPDDVSPDEVATENAEQMTGSQENAKAAALRELDLPVVERVVVQSIVEGAPALGKLEARDVILAVDDVEIASAEDVVEVVTGHEPGEDVTFTVKRDGEVSDVTITTTEAPPPPASGPDEPTAAAEPRAFVGIAPGSGFEFPFEVDITLGEDIGGPSAGLVFALAIVDKLTPGALTAGASIAGTGSIQADGVVLPIGGIQQKVRGAREAGATVFLVPAADCAGAVSAEVDGIQLVRVETLADARQSLESIAAGDTDVPVCAAA